MSRTVANIRKHCLLVLSLVAVACGDGAPTTPGNNGGADAGSPDAAVGGDHGGSDASMSPDTGAEADLGPPPGSTEPIEAPTETWTWVEFPNAACGNGTPAGIGVNVADRTDDVFVYMMGGGACWDVNSCFVLKSAVNIESGYGQARFENEGALTASAFDRDNPDNPFRDMSWVFIPYCTGDVHAGTHINRYEAVGQTRDIHHVGANNVTQFLARLGPTFAAAERVFVSGSSAGGYGAQLNAHRFIDTFPDAEVHVLSDSAPLIQPYSGRIGAWDAAWRMAPPSGCDGCARNFPDWFDHLAATYTDTRFGLLAYEADETIHLYFGYPLDGSFEAAVARFVADNMTPPSNAHTFLMPGNQHVMLHQLTTLEHPNGTPLRDWVQGWISGESWEDAIPD